MLTVISLFTIVAATPSLGFGKNKVQYKPLLWKSVKSPHFVTYLHQGCDSTLVPVAPVWIEKAYFALQSKFLFTHKTTIPLIIYGSPGLFTQTNIITELLPEEVGGFTEIFKNRIAIPFNGSYKDFRHVLHHELVHAFIFGMLTDQFGNNLLTSGNIQLPLWFMEGAAEYLSSGWDTDADMFLIDRTLNSYIPLPGPELGGYMAYKGGQSFLFFLASSRGDSLFQKFLLDFKKNKSVESALKKTYRTPVEDLGKEWVRELRRLYWPEIGCRQDPSREGKAISNHEESHDYYNLRPRISPDGKKIAFFSDHYDYTRILITDTTGKILQSISQSGYGGFFESFHPFRSGLCWAPDGKSIAFVTNSQGSDEIRIVDLSHKKLRKRIKTHLTSISSPDWSKDGKMLTFTAVDSGKSDLYLYSLDKQLLTQLTCDVRCESDPHFSPDGSTILFGVEDSTSMIPSAVSSPWGSAPGNLATYSLRDSTQSQLTTTPWSEKQPCFSPDGRHILFVSNRNGIDNLYIAPLDTTSAARALTNYTGSSTTPDWSAGSDKVAFTLFHNQGWDIRTIDKPFTRLINDTLQPTRWVASFSDSTHRFFTPATIPEDTSAPPAAISLQRDTTRVGNLPGAIPQATVDDSATSKPATDSLRSDHLTVAPVPSIDRAAPADTLSKGIANKDSLYVHDFTDTMHLRAGDPYRISFTPDMVSVGVGMGTAYSPAGQMLIALSDLMGDHRITFAGDLQGNIDEYAHLFFSYFYLKHRIDIGGGAFYTKDFALASIFGNKIYHEMQYGGFGTAQYPLSMFSRVELQTYASHLEQDVLYTEDPTLVSNSAQTSVSYVFDNILWGITGPLNGIRAQASMQLSPPLSFITQPYIAFESDIRHYTHLFKRFVWANRLYLGSSFSLNHKGSARRYLLGGNENWFLYQLNVEEYEQNIQYSLYSNFVTPFRGWNYVDLWGTKTAVLNTEFRFPFIRDITVVWPLPMQVQYISGAVFADIGNAWDKQGTSFSLSLPDKVYGGYGFGMRANLGIFILRFDRGWPTDWQQHIGTPINYFSMGAEF